MMKNMRTTINILTMSHLFEVMPLKYFSSSVWAASTLACVSLTFVSILREKRRVGIGYVYVCSQALFKLQVSSLEVRTVSPREPPLSHTCQPIPHPLPILPSMSSHSTSSHTPIPWVSHSMSFHSTSSHSTSSHSMNSHSMSSLCSHLTTCSSCSWTISASCLKIEPSSTMVEWMFSIASARSWM